MKSDTLEIFCEEWGAASYCELAVLLAATRALAIIHQTNHWSSSGQSQYGDHQLFQRMYSDVDGNIDIIAERIVGLSTSQMVDYSVSVSQTERIIKECVGNEADPVKTSMSAEQYYLILLKNVAKLLDRQDLLTYGTDNLLAGIADQHETHIYLLKQRLQK